MPLQILYEDNHLLIVNKQAGLVTQPSDNSKDSLENRCKTYLKESCNKPGAVYLHPVHRLDKPVSGIVVFAKTSKALSRLNEAQRQKEWHKRYSAEVEGIINPGEATLSHYLKHDDFKTLISESATEEFKLAKLSYKVVEFKTNSSLLEIDLDTGRYHQIRAQLSFVGHPILGDHRYGSSFLLPSGAIALCHSSLEFPHPISGNTMNIECTHSKWS